MQKEQSDQELKLKKRARRRLVGAVALVLFMVIVLPMVLKDRVASIPQDKITITMPNESIPTTVNPSDFDSSVVPNETEKQPQNAESASPSVAQMNTQPHAEAKEDTKTGDTAKSEIAPTEDKPAPHPKPEPPKQETKTVKTEKTEKSEKPADAHKFSVQIGVFSDPTNVKQLQAKLSALGYQSKTEKINTEKGEKIRLKTQSFADRNEAAIALQNIKDAGLTGMVISQ